MLQRKAPNAHRRPVNILADGFRATRGGFLTAIAFSFFINILVFVGPLYMLQIYDRVITSRSVVTLLGLTVIAGFLLIVYAFLEKIRSAILVRLGIEFQRLREGASSMRC